MDKVPENLHAHLAKANIYSRTYIKRSAVHTRVRTRFGAPSINYQSHLKRVYNRPNDAFNLLNSIARRAVRRQQQQQQSTYEIYFVCIKSPILARVRTCQRTPFPFLILCEMVYICIQRRPRRRWRRLFCIYLRLYLYTLLVVARAFRRARARVTTRWLTIKRNNKRIADACARACYLLIFMLLGVRVLVAAVYYFYVCPRHISAIARALHLQCMA